MQKETDRQTETERQSGRLADRHKSRHNIDRQKQCWREKHTDTLTQLAV